MPHFGKPVGVAYVDVDLVSSTGDCLRHLYPLLVPGGAIYSKDAHLSGIVELLENERFWNEGVGVERPVMERACEQITGGTGGIRTLEGLLTLTHFPGVRLQPLGHRSSPGGASSRAMPPGPALERATEARK